MEDVKENHATDKSNINFEYGLTPEEKARIQDLLENDLNHELQKSFLNLHPADQAAFVTNISYDLREKLIKIIKSDIDPQFLTYLENDVKNEVIECLGTKASAKAIDKLEVDDAVEVIEDLEQEGMQEILDNISTQKRSEIEESLSYPEESVGRIMQRNFVAVKKDWTVGQATRYIQEKTDLPDDFHYIVIVDDSFHPIAEVLVSKIVRSRKNVPVSEVMSNEEDIKILSVNMDQEEAAKLFSKYSLTYAPVVDENNEMIGVIYASDVIDVLTEEAEEDILLLGGVNNNNLHLSSILTAKSRIPWLFTSLMTTSMAVTIIAIFSGEIQKIVVLAVLMPIVASIAGNVGTQALTVLVRSIATDEVSNIGAAKIVLKEVLVSSVNGLFLAAIATIACYFWQHDIKLSLVLGSSMLFTIVVAGFSGAFIPIFLNKIKFDPAVSSGVFLITITDTSSFLIFLGLASLFLN